GVALPLDELDRHLFLADIVSSATAAREPTLSKAQAAAALSARRHRPRLLVDLAVPAATAAYVPTLREPFPSTADDLERAVEDNRQSRREAADAADAIVDLQVSRYVEVLAAATRNAPLKRLRAHGESTRADVLAKAKQQLAAGQSPEAVLDFLAHTLTNRLLHAPTVALREAAISGDTDLMHAVDRLMHGAAADKDDDAADPAP